MGAPVESLIEQGRAALDGLAEALHMESDYSRPSRDAFERAYGAYRKERNAVGAYRCARMIAFHHGGGQGDWALFHGWMQRAATLPGRDRRRASGGASS